MTYALDSALLLSMNEANVFDVLVFFVESYDYHNGLYILKHNKPGSNAINEVTFKLKIKNDKFLPAYKDLYIGEVDVRDLKIHSDIADGAIALNYGGIIFDDHRYVKTAYPDDVCDDAKSGAGHIFLASASLHPDITAFVCSAEKGTVKAFKLGQLARQMIKY